MRRARRVLAFVGLRGVVGGRGGLQDVGRHHIRALRATARRPLPSSSRRQEAACELRHSSRRHSRRRAAAAAARPRLSATHSSDRRSRRRCACRSRLRAP
eukprot:2575566-Prymnesium_polylepis.1